jgi:hypothetical protein
LITFRPAVPVSVTLVPGLLRFGGAWVFAKPASVEEALVALDAAALIVLLPATLCTVPPRIVPAAPEVELPVNVYQVPVTIELLSAVRVPPLLIPRFAALAAPPEPTEIPLKGVPDLGIFTPPLPVSRIPQ